MSINDKGLEDAIRKLQDNDCLKCDEAYRSPMGDKHLTSDDIHEALNPMYEDNQEEIRKAFEEEFALGITIEFRENCYYSKDEFKCSPITNTWAFRVNDKWEGYKAGQQSRDEEIEELNKRDIESIMLIKNMGKQLSEAKKQIDSMKNCGNCGARKSVFLGNEMDQCLFCTASDQWKPKE